MGSTVEFEITRYNIKNGVNLTKEQMVCKKCGGSGTVVNTVRRGPLISQTSTACPNCNGQGISMSDECFVKEKKKFSKSVPKGIRIGQKIVLENQGNEIPDCFKNKGMDLEQDRSDIILKISEKGTYEIENYRYIRDLKGDPYNLELEIKIEAHEAICGTIKNIPFLNGERVNIKIPHGIAFSNNHVVIIPKMGLPIYKQKNIYGDLFITIAINKPKITDGQYEKIWNILTDTSMTKTMKEILKKGKNEYIDAITVEKYKKSDAFKKAQQQYAYDDDNEEQQNMQCAQQ